MINFWETIRRIEKKDWEDCYNISMFPDMEIDPQFYEADDYVFNTATLKKLIEPIEKTQGIKVVEIYMGKPGEFLFTFLICLDYKGEERLWTMGYIDSIAHAKEVADETIRLRARKFKTCTDVYKRGKLVETEELNEEMQHSLISCCKSLLGEELSADEKKGIAEIDVEGIIKYVQKAPAVKKLHEMTAGEIGNLPLEDVHSLSPELRVKMLDNMWGDGRSSR